MKYGSKLATILLFFGVALFAMPIHADPIQTGDLIYLDLDCGELCDAIEAVTKKQFGVDGPNLSHVGVLYNDKNIQGEGSWFVYEAWSGVQKTPLTEVLNRVKQDPSRVHLRRIRILDQEKQQDLMKFLNAQLGIPYDDEFLVNNGKYYCSELVAEAFNEALHDSVFRFSPMAYGETEGAPWRTWQAYFEKIGMDVPQGEPGVSPLGLFLQDRFQVDIDPPAEWFRP